jgi:hypothetical protein
VQRLAFGVPFDNAINSASIHVQMDIKAHTICKNNVHHKTQIHEIGMAACTSLSADPGMRSSAGQDLRHGCRFGN